MPFCLYDAAWPVASQQRTAKKKRIDQSRGLRGRGMNSSARIGRPYKVIANVTDECGRGISSAGASDLARPN
jgi:hypothetical protein